MVQISDRDHIVDLFRTPGPQDPRVFHTNHPFIPFPIFLVACVRAPRLAVPAVPVRHAATACGEVVRGSSPSQHSAAAPDTCYCSHLVSPLLNLYNLHQVSLQPVVQSSCIVLDICYKAAMLESCI